MAMASEIYGDDDDEFFEYNPHPYQGGYDLALTYGHPLPPSPSTCYPLHPSSSSAPPPPLSPSPPSPSPPPPPRTSPPLSPSPPPPRTSPPLSPLPPPTRTPPPYDYVPDLYRYGFSSFLCASEEVEYWRELRRAGDYLFGYSEGLGERRIGIDSYGIPIYADKMQAQQPLSLYYQPAAEHRLDHCGADSDGTDGNWHNQKIKDEGCGDAYYDSRYNEEPISVQHSNVEMVMPLRLTYHEEQENPHLEWCYSVERKDERYDHASYYDWQHYEEPLRVQHNKAEMAMPQRLTYHEEQENAHLEWHSSYTEGGSGSSFYGYPQHDYERHHNEHQPSVELEPYKSTWSQNLSYQEVYEGETSSPSYWNSSFDGTCDVRDTIQYHNHTDERHYCYENQLSDQLEPFKPAWTQNQHFYEPFVEVSQSNWADNSGEGINQYFSSYLSYSQYDE